MDDTKALDLYFAVDGKQKPQRVGGYGSLFWNFWEWSWVKQLLLQILVVVASIQTRTLKAEVTKGSMITVIGHGLVDPK